MYQVCEYLHVDRFVHVFPPRENEDVWDRLCCFDKQKTTKLKTTKKYIFSIGAN